MSDSSKANFSSSIIGKPQKPIRLKGDGLYNGFYRATVLTRLDPEKQHRIKVRCDSVFGEIVEDDLPWCYPMLPAWTSPTYDGGGYGAVPPVGAPVLICFEGGNPHYPMYIGGWWGLESSSCHTPTHAHGYDNLPDNYYFTTPRGTTVQLDDRKSRKGKGSNNEKILLRLPEGDYITINIDGKTQLRPEKQLDLRTTVRIEIQCNNRIEIKAKDVSVYAQNNVSIQGGKTINVRGGSAVNVDASRINLNCGSAQAVDGQGQKITTDSEQDGN